MRVLRWAVNAGARYLGMIGSRRKTISIYKELEKEGIPAEKFANVHAPVGLEIGAVTPEEIAVAIVAEMIAERRHARPRCQQDVFLSDKPHVRARRTGRRRRRAGAKLVVVIPSEAEGSAVPPRATYFPSSFSISGPILSGGVVGA